MNKWDKYFYDMCVTASSKSPCLSRKIGALLVRDKSIVSLGFNGPPRGVPHCGEDRLLHDRELIKIFYEEDAPDVQRHLPFCPRKILGYASGTHMELCPAQHAEENAVSNAARSGVSVNGSTLYMNSIIPCQKCFGTLINAGVVEIVIERLDYYDKFTPFLHSNSNITVREFQL